MNEKNSNIILKIIIPLILCISFFLISSLSIKDKTNTTDEGFHLVRGIMLLKTKDYRLNQHHPFLANAIHSIPAVLNKDLKTPDLEGENWKYAKKDQIAWELIGVNGGDIDFSKNILYGPRLINIFFSTIFIFIFYQIVFKLFGKIPAIVSSIFLSISPTFIAHSSLVTTDTPVTALIFLKTISLVFFVKYYKNAKRKKQILAIFIILSFLSLITKYTAIVPFFTCTLFLVGYIFFKEKNLLNTLKTLLIILTSVFLLSFASYGFRTDTLKNSAYGNENKIEDDYKHINKLPTEPLNLQGFIKNTYENVKIPMPEYVRGFYENVFKHNLYGHKSFFLGEISDKGWTMYFPTTFTLKEPIPTIILSLTSISFSIWYLIKQKKIKNEYIILIIVPVILLLLSMKSSLNLGVRHLLPIFPFIFLLIGVVVGYFYEKNKKLVFASMVPLIVFMYFSVLISFPHYIEYFNEFIGKRENGYKYLRDSNLSWGQNKYFVEKYKKENPEENYEIIEIKVETPFPKKEILDYISNTHWVVEEEK